jgi:hypothetical protein
MAHYGGMVKPWYPKVKTGFFWARDNLFYLYGDKQYSTLDQLRWYKFTFTGEIVPGTAVATFEATTLTEDQWTVRGTELIFKSAGFNVTGDETISVSGEQLLWNTGDETFNTGEFTWNSAVASGEVVFVLDPAPKDAAPIVVTDTSVASTHDTGELPYGFSILYDEDLEQVVVTFQSGELPEDRFVGAVAGDPYIVNDVISNFTWGAFAEYGTLINFPGLQTWGMFTRSLDFGELSAMTIEWEGSQTGIYEITDLSINPIHNSKADGFLSIRNVRDEQFDRTLVSGESTLLDDWAEGRISETLPWAKVLGKNKWHPLIREFSAPRPRPATYAYPTGELTVIDSMPGPLVALQGTTGEEVLFTFLDQEENPWAFEMTEFSLSTTLVSDTERFPGYIAKRSFGVYSKLGQDISEVETDSGGHVALRYTPPSVEHISLFTPEIVSSGDFDWFATTYDVYPDNYGNPTIVDQWDDLVALTGELSTGEYTGTYSSGFYTYDLTIYPVRDTVVVEDGGVRQQVVYQDQVQDGQVYIDIENKQIKSKSDGPLNISFTPALIWKDPAQPRRLYLDTGQLSLPSNYVVGYDAWIRLTGTDGDVSQVHDIVCRNPYNTGDM